MSRIRPITVASATFTAATLAMWALAADWSATGTDLSAVPLESRGAVAVTVIAALCWFGRALLNQKAERAERDRERARQDEDLSRVIRTLASAVPTQPVKTASPFPRAL